MLQALQFIPYRDLDLDYRSKILGQSRHGLVLQAEYCSMFAAVKPLLPAANPDINTVFSPRALGLQRESSLDEVQPQYILRSEPLVSSDNEQEFPNSSSSTLLEGNNSHMAGSPRMSGSAGSFLQQRLSAKLFVQLAVRKLSGSMAFFKSAMDGSLYRQAKLMQEVHSLLSLLLK